MQVQRLNFPDVIPDNEIIYLDYLEGLIGSVDSDCDIMIYRKPEGLLTRIAPSDISYFHSILQIIKKFHTMLGIQVEFSKSMRAGYNISYTINF